MGIEYKANWLSESERWVLKIVCERELRWVEERVVGRIRIRRYGWDYEDLRKWVGEVPEEFPKELRERFDSVTLNEYVEGRRIGAHVDSMGYDDDICVLSLGEEGVIIFHGEPEIRMRLGDGSLLHFWGEERTRIKHSTEPCVGLRYSLVFRNKRE